MSKVILKGQCHAILGVRGEGRERGKNGKAGGGPQPLFFLPISPSTSFPVLRLQAILKAKRCLCIN